MSESQRRRLGREPAAFIDASGAETWSSRAPRVPVRVAVGDRSISASVSPENEAAIWVALEDAWHETTRRITAKGGRL